MAKLFISYSRDDKELVDDMVSDLQSVSHSAWMDSELTGGQSWWDRILQEIQHCDFFLIALSKAMLKSEACERELRYASALGKTIIPVKVKNDFSDNLLPSYIGRLHITDFDGGSKQGLLALIRAVDTSTISPSLPDPLPEAPSIPVSYLAELLEVINSRESLDYDQQAALLVKLRNHFNTTGEGAGVLQSLNQFESRRDLLASIGKGLSDLKADIEGSANSSAQVDPPQRAPEPKTPEPAYTEPQNSRKTTEQKSTETVGAATYLLSGVSMLVPLVGIVLFFIWRKEKPKSAKWVACGAGLGILLYLAFSGSYESDYYY